MKINVIRFRYQREHVKSDIKLWVTERTYSYEFCEEVIKFIESWQNQHDNSKLQSNS